MTTKVMTAAMTEEQVAEAEAAAAALAPEDNSFAAVQIRASVIPHREWIRSNTQREKLRLAWSAFFEDWDILICPQMATPAFPHDQSPMVGRTLTVDNEEQPYFQQLFWAGMIVNAYLPSTVFPTGPSRDGLPIGVQAVSAPYRDYRYRRLSIGFYLDSVFFGSRYWINDPWTYRLPAVYGPYRWVRYYDDVLLVNTYSGEVVDVIHDFFW